jgi:hypothetical protein
MPIQGFGHVMIRLRLLTKRRYALEPTVIFEIFILRLFCSGRSSADRLRHYCGKQVTPTFLEESGCIEIQEKNDFRL